VVSFTLRPLYPRDPLDRRAPEPVWTTWRREYSWPYRGSKSDPSAVEPVTSRYTDWAIPASPKIRRNVGHPQLRWRDQHDDGDEMLLKRSCCGLLWDSIQIFAFRDWEKREKSVGTDFPRTLIDAAECEAGTLPIKFGRIPYSHRLSDYNVLFIVSCRRKQRAVLALNKLCVVQVSTEPSQYFP
jgi:hypothetical protein